MIVMIGLSMARIDVEGMTCAVCVSHVEKAILSVQGVTNAAVNLAFESAEYQGDADVKDVIEAINSSGYKAMLPVEFSERLEKMQKDVSSSLAISTPALIIALGIMFYVMSGGNEYLHIVAFFFVFLLNGWKTLLKGVNSLYQGLNMYSLVFIAFLSALVWSLIYPDDSMWEATYISALAMSSLKSSKLLSFLSSSIR